MSLKDPQELQKRIEKLEAANASLTAHVRDLMNIAAGNIEATGHPNGGPIVLKEMNLCTDLKDVVREAEALRRIATSNG